MNQSLLLKDERVNKSIEVICCVEDDAQNSLALLGGIKGKIDLRYLKAPDLTEL